MHVGILGPLEVMAGGQVVKIGGARLRALLIRLALDAGRVVTVEALAQALWPDGRPRDPAHALQSLMSRLRRALPEQSPVRAADGGYCLDLPPQAVDVLWFERLVSEGRHALRNGKAAGAARLLREALGLWRGEPLAEVADAPYAGAVAVRLRELRLAAIEDRVEADLTTGPEPTNLVAELEELTALHPLRERLRGLLVRALHADGRRAEALTAYDDFRRLVAEELGSDPGPELRRAHLAVLRDEEISRHRADVRRSGNLPTGLGSFVGRAREQRRITAQVTDGRLITLVGPGGVGKTRLATVVAAGLTDGLPGGRWLVELAPVTDPDGVPQAVIDALRLREAGPLDTRPTPRDAVSRLVEALSSAEAVIVLDNCEHLIDAAAHLAEALLSRCPLLRIIATSREPLGIGGEMLCPVPPLGLPEPDASAEQALARPAVRLFANRATAVRPGFTVNEDNVAAVTDICRRLDGLPLAIELAAARLRSLPVDELAARLGDRFALLTGGSRTALPRHRTLRAVIGWSWDLLTDDERRLARRLAAFPGDAGLESAERVAGGTLDQLTALVDKSLLEFDGARYRMLETIREYGLEEMADDGELAEVKTEHAAYCLDLARRGEAKLRGGGQVPWFRKLKSEQGNLLGALRFACDTGDAPTAVELAAALGLFWTICGNHAEAANRLRLALAVPGEAATESRTIATAFYLFNAILSGHPRAADTIGSMPEGTDHAGHRIQHPAAALFEPALAVFNNDIAMGLAVVDRRLSHPDPWARAMLRFMRVFLQGDTGGLAAMRSDLQATVTAFRETGERWGLAQSLTYMAYDQITLGDVDAAIVELEESIRLLRELDPADDAGLQRVLLATAHAQSGQVEQARAELFDLVASGATRSSPGFLAYARITLGDLARHDGDLEEAARQLDRAADALDHAALDTPPFRAMLASAMGQLATAEGDLSAAQRHLLEAITSVVEMPDPPIAAGVAVAVARLRARRGAPRDAAELLGAAYALRGTPDSSNPDVVNLVHELRASLDEHTYQSAYTQGSALDGASALVLVKTTLGQPPLSREGAPHAPGR
jgi:predicted ATPase/DNA-binding SARP family transcriptional activator/tetratricopeptide (TPR) repeat protein